MADSYFSTPNRLKTQAQMEALLKQRVHEAVGPTGSPEGLQKSEGTGGVPIVPRNRMRHREPIIKTVEEMNALLAARVAKSSAPSAAAQPSFEPSKEGSGTATVGAVLPAVTWLKPTPGREAILSTCGRFSIARSTVNGERQYQAWRRLPEPTRLGTKQAHAKACMAIVEEYLNGLT